MHTCTSVNLTSVVGAARMADRLSVRSFVFRLFMSATTQLATDDADLFPGPPPGPPLPPLEGEGEGGGGAGRRRRRRLRKGPSGFGLQVCLYTAAATTISTIIVTTHLSSSHISHASMIDRHSNIACPISLCRAISGMLLFRLSFVVCVSCRLCLTLKITASVDASARSVSGLR